MSRPPREDDWLAELAKMSARSDKGLTAKEWAQKLGLSYREAKVRLGEAHRRGWLKSGRRTVTAINGNRAQVPVYTVERPKAGRRG